MTKLADAIANAVKAGQDQDWAKLGTSIRNCRKWNQLIR